MSSGSKTTTQSSASEPWKPAQGLLKTGLQEADSIFKSGTAFGPNTTNMVVPFSDQTSAGMTDIQNKAGAMMSGPNAFDKGFNALGGMIDNGGQTGDMRGVMDQWKNTASGAELNNLAPEFQNVLSRVQGDTRDQVNLGASAAGRYGSGMHTGVLADRVGDVTSRMLTDEYGRQLGRQDAARGNLYNAGNTGNTNVMNAIQGLPGAYQAQQQPATDMMKIGSMYEDLYGRQLDDQNRIFEGMRDAPKLGVEWLNAIGSGAGGLGGVQSGSTTSPAPNPFLSAIAGATGLNNLFGNPLGQMTGSVVNAPFMF